LWIAQHRYLCPDAIWIGVGVALISGQGLNPVRQFGYVTIIWNALSDCTKNPGAGGRMMALPQFALKAIGQRLA
jgi:N-acetylglucosaminyldiphosphoundecaprenol N-acetyl-beta-D-mannosaminyltransferase